MTCSSCNGEGEIYEAGGMKIYHDGKRRPAGWYRCFRECGSLIDRTRDRHRVSAAEVAAAERDETLPHFRAREQREREFAQWQP